MKTGIALFLAGALPAKAEIAGAELEPWLVRAITNVNYQPPAPGEFTRARELFEQTLRGDRAVTELKTNWATLGFGFYEVSLNGEKLWLVSEPEGKEFGRGLYLFRTRPASPAAIEAPHARNDIHTGRIGFRMFLGGDARVFAAATITRHRADIAHLDNTFFQAFTLAFTNVCPTGLVAQLHGFESDNHTKVKADVIAADGTRTPGAWFGDAVNALRKATSLTVLGFPADTTALGATQNSQGDAIRKNGQCRFLHLEFTKELRDRMVDDAKLCRALAEVFSTISKR